MPDGNERRQDGDNRVFPYQEVRQGVGNGVEKGVAVVGGSR